MITGVESSLNDEQKNHLFFASIGCILKRKKSSAKHAWRYAYFRGTFFINSFLCTLRSMQSFFMLTRRLHVACGWSMLLYTKRYQREKRQKTFLWMQHSPAAVIFYTRSPMSDRCWSRFLYFYSEKHTESHLGCRQDTRLCCSLLVVHLHLIDSIYFKLFLCTF